MQKDSLTPEEQWFHEKEARLRQRMREEIEGRAAAEQNKRKIKAGLGTDDKTVIERIQALGLDGDVVQVIHLLPLVQIAWADGTVSVNERVTILRAAEAHGIEPGTRAATFLASLLEWRPSDTLLDEILAVLREILAVKGLRATSLLEACENVAKASGGLLGFGNKVSVEEQDAIGKVAEALGPAIDEKIGAKLG
ncbi:MAG: tellurite resistance TerB family protein [Planctomycetota bacterium]|jgi:hypothetical protein